MEGRLQWSPEASHSCASPLGQTRWSAENSGKALNKEGSELLQPSSVLMQFPVGVALRDLANFAAGQVTRVISQKKSIILLWREAAIYVGVIKICLPTSYSGASVAKHRKRQEEIRSGRKGREEWSICRQWFSTCSVYHVIREQTFWFHCVLYSGGSGRIRLWRTVRKMGIT